MPGGEDGAVAVCGVRDADGAGSVGWAVFLAVERVELLDEEGAAGRVA